MMHAVEHRVPATDGRSHDDPFYRFISHLSAAAVYGVVAAFAALVLAATWLWIGIPFRILIGLAVVMAAIAGILAVEKITLGVVRGRQGAGRHRRRATGGQRV